MIVRDEENWEALVDGRDEYIVLQGSVLISAVWSLSFPLIVYF